MQFRIAASIFIISCTVTVAALADQDDQRLDGLFLRLQTTENPTEARTLESLIWTIWFVYDGDSREVAGLMRNGAAAMNVRNFDRAEVLLTRVTELAPDFAEGWNRRATARFLAGDFSGSVADIQRTLQLEPRHFGALSGLGAIYTELDDPDRALAAFEAALEIHPHLPGARANVQHLRELLDGDPV